MRSLIAAALALAAGASGLCLTFAAAAADTPALPRYQLETNLDPTARTLDARATVELPAPMAGQAVEFLLAAPLEILASDPQIEKLPADSATGFSGINGSSQAMTRSGRAARYRIQLAPGSRQFTLHYKGRVDFGFETPGQEYARGFNETAGVIKEDGVYLAGSTLWYPYLGDTLFTFELTARSPNGWQLISPGNGTARDAAGVTHWRSDAPLDELHIVGGPLTRYARAAGAVTAEVYLRKPDDALAAKYLEATARNLEMYRGLIGTYPYEKFALVENFWETGYGMPSFTLLGPQIIRFPFILTSSYPHEILHNWWGNGVFVDYASGNWCEGLTAYLADHLYKEQQSQGAEYRRDTLKKYRDFVREARDFPLSEFRSRHSPATEAVGYGKALMLFHMTRRKIGDEAFKRGLQKFYREQRGKRATFTDLARAFSAAGETDLLPFYEQWVTRAGAPDLRIDKVEVVGSKTSSGSYTVRGVLRQVQKVAPFALDVPIAIRTRAGLELFTVANKERNTAFELTTNAEPLAVEVDPEFDLFRLLDARETAPSLGQMFGDPEIVAVLPASAGEAENKVYREMIEFWGGGNAQKIAVRLDSSKSALPSDRAVWVFGRGNRLAKQLFGDDPAIGFTTDDKAIEAAGAGIPFAAHSAVIVKRNPGNPAKAIGWVTVDPPAAGPGLARKLPHYGKYSYLGFEGTEPANVVKGEWVAADSPLHVELLSTRPAGVSTNKYPTRAPLAVLPAVFDGAAMLVRIRWLADPARDGRGLTTPGLEAAGDYVAEAFKQAGLAPGNGDSWFQPFEFTPPGAQQAVRTRNVIGVLRGANPAFADQAIIVSAHYDHLGRSGPGVRVEEVGQLHPGADDNASGVAVMLELARTLAAAGAPPRTIVFIGFSGEESGLNGSKFYVSNPTPVPLAGIRAVVNLDTVGRLGNGEVTALATGTATEWQHVLRGITFTTGIATKSIPGASQSSDQQSFIEHGIPGIQLFTKAHLDYHRPTDTADKIDVDGLVKVATVARETVDYLAQRAEPLTITIDTAANAAAQAKAPSGPDGTSRRVSFGLVPDYAQTGKGVKAESVVPDSPAALAGIVAGDVLLALDGVPIDDLGAFSNALKRHQAGDTVKATILRDGAERIVTVELLAR
ncbi:MAG TPA: M20/M25/M40 family metallo-hydrolase [Steroidobacteraceae bacterium]|nr:M20/M25/M40 family metallo-hydrolase [Steroidobacteraceae bacterium]HRX89176.1 M20/M25/M40 family metallo-hydrolase [Steroidobacteraceae bacterium]